MNRQENPEERMSRRKALMRKYEATFPALEDIDSKKAQYCIP